MPPRGKGYSSRGRGSGSGRPSRSKGGHKIYSSFEEVQRRNKELSRDETKEEEEEQESEEEESDEEVQDGEKANFKSNGGGDRGQAGSSDEDGFEICNPNRNRREVEKTGITELSRREREQLAKLEYDRKLDGLRAQGKTQESKADLERLAAIRKKREEERMKKEQKAKETNKR